MAPKWNEVASDERFQALPEEEKGQVRQRYWDNVVSQDPGYAGMPDADKMKVQERFFGTPPDNVIESGFQRTKEFFIDKPAAGAAVLRDATKGAVGLADRDVVDTATQTGSVPYGKIALATAADVATNIIPMTPTEIAIQAFGGKLISKIPALAGRVAAEFPRLAEILSKPIFGGAVESMADKEAAVMSQEVEDFAKVSNAPAPKPVTDTPVPATEAPVAAAAPGELPSPAAPVPAASPVAATAPVAAAEKVAAATEVPDKDIFGQQLAKFDTGSNPKAIFAETSKVFKGEINEARRGVVDVENTKRVADLYGWDYEDLIKRRGKAFTAEELHAAKGLTVRSLEELDVVRQAYKADPSPENLIGLQQQIARHAAVQESFLGVRAEAGRALNILKYTAKAAKRGTAEAADIGQKNMDKILEQMGGKEVSEEIAKRFASIDPENMVAVNKFARDVMKAKISDQIYEVWINSILSSPGTQGRNILGNVSFLASKVPEKIVRGITDLGASVITGNRTAYASEAAPELVGLIQGVRDGARAGLQSLLGEAEDTVTKLDAGKLPQIGGKLGEVIRLPTRMLSAADDFFKGVVYRGELNAQAFRMAKGEGLRGDSLFKRAADLVENPTPEISKAVREEQLMRTFQDDNKFAKWVSGIHDFPGGRYVVPFIRTPANIAARGLERSPFGFIKAGVQLAKGAGQEQVVKDTANAMYGSVISAAIASYALEGKITGAAPSDPAGRDRFFRSGKIPYAIKIGDTWHSYSALEPLSMVLGVTADTVLRKVASDENDPGMLELAGVAAAAAAKNMVSKPFLSGMRDVMDALADGERNGPKLLKRWTGSLVPGTGFMRFLAFQMDPYVRDAQGVSQTIKSNIPWLSKTVPPKLDVYGNPDRRADGVVLQSSRERINPLDIEDDQLDRKTGFVSQRVGPAKLTQDEYAQVLRQRGDLLKTTRLDLLKDPDWKNLDPTEKKNMIDKITNMAGKEAKMNVYLQVLKRLPAGDKKDEFIEYGVNTLGLDPQELLPFRGR